MYFSTARASIMLVGGLQEQRVHIARAAPCVYAKTKLRRAAGALVYFRLRVSIEGTCRREFAELVAHHIFRYIHRNKLASVVHSKRVPDKVWSNQGVTTPRFDYLLFLGLIERVYFALQLVVDVWALA